MIKISIPYKSHSNKSLWDYIITFSGQLNNINGATNLSNHEASVDNVVYVVFSNYKLMLLVSLSRDSGVRDENENVQFSPFFDVWAPMSDVGFDISNNPDEESCQFRVFSFDIKKYNSVLSFTENYQNRNEISIYLDMKQGKIYYQISNQNFVDLSPIVIDQKQENRIKSAYEEYTSHLSKDNPDSFKLRVDTVDKNSFLLPFMGYKDFLNFAVFSTHNKSAIIKDKDSLYFINNLYNDNGDLLFYSKVLLRCDKFYLSSDSLVQTPMVVSSGLWQILTILQHSKAWDNLFVYANSANLFLATTNSKNKDIQPVTHVFYDVSENEAIDSTLLYPDLNNFELVGKLHSNELFRLNKLYSNANRTCFFDFSSQTFTGNNYVFNENKLDQKTVCLDNESNIDAKLPLKITFTEIKHYIGSDLSQKNFYLYVYTDGIRVMLERWNFDCSVMECRVIFNHAMSKKNQNL